MACDVPRSSFLAPDEPEDLLPTRFRDGLERELHGAHRKRPVTYPSSYKDEAVSPARAETVLSEEPLRSQSVVFLDGAHHVVTAHVCAHLVECTCHPFGIVVQRWNARRTVEIGSRASRDEGAP